MITYFLRGKPSAPSISHFLKTNENLVRSRDPPISEADRRQATNCKRKKVKCKHFNVHKILYKISHKKYSGSLSLYRKVHH